MPIVRSIADLPDPDRPQGRKPDAEPRFVHLLAEKWAADNAERDAGYKRRNRFHLSDAGKCARAVAYGALEVPASDPMDLTGIHNTRLGTIIHEAWQAVLASAYPDAQIEPHHLIMGGEGSGYSDAALTASGSKGDGTRIVIEFKTIGGFGYKLAVGERGTAQGPSFAHVAQGALNAVAADADELVIAYLSKEAISVMAASRKKISEIGRFASEWTYQRDEFEPIAAAEEARVLGILALLDEGDLPARKIPGGELPPGAKITDPATGAWTVHALTEDDTDPHGTSSLQIVDVGSYALCNYCKWQTVCGLTEAGRQPIADVAVALGIKS